MAVRFLIVCLLALVFSASSGCRKEEKKLAEDYGSAMVEAIEGSKAIARDAGLDSAKAAIEGYHALNGRYPADMQEISELMGGKFRAEDYVYDPATGGISLKK